MRSVKSTPRGRWNTEHEPSVRFPALKAVSPMAFFSRASFNLISVAEGSVDIVLYRVKGERRPAKKEIRIGTMDNTVQHFTGPRHDDD
jgi:hypothetical protein